MPVRYAAIAAVVLAFATTSVSASSPPPLTIRVVGNHFVNGQNRTIRLIGVNRSTFEYACSSGYGLYEGPVGNAAIAAMTSWNIDVVRIPLNEACWLGSKTVKRRFRGPAYRNAVIGFVKRLHAAGLYTILDLHWNAPGTEPADSQQYGPDQDHSPAFWTSVASTFRNDQAMIFDAYNEPRMLGWGCWRNGCISPDGWRTAGMQELVNAIRATGARQPIMLGGLGGAIALYGWLGARPRDPAHQLVAAFHSYNFTGCSSEVCWNASVLPVARKVPVVTGEMTENDCAHGYIDAYMAWADAHGISYLGWTWNPWNCAGAHGMILDWKGTPNSVGVGLKNHLATLDLGGAAPP